LTLLPAKVWEHIKVETLVTITLEKEGKGTRLTLVHSGWDALPPGEQGVADTYGSGWVAHLEKLREQIDGSERKNSLARHQRRTAWNKTAIAASSEVTWFGISFRPVWRCSAASRAAIPR
jgi:hypothetical protein